MSSSEKFQIQWNDFQQNIVTSFISLKDDQNLLDVTLVCEDGKKIEAHRIALVASSPFFHNILKATIHTHPMIYMRGVKSKEIKLILDFMYKGEVSIDISDLNIFLALGAELGLKGLNSTEVEDKSEIYSNRIDNIGGINHRTNVSENAIVKDETKNEDILSDTKQIVSAEYSINTNDHLKDKLNEMMDKINL